MTIQDDLTGWLADEYGLGGPVTVFPLEHAGLNNQNVGISTSAGAYVVRTCDSPSYDDPASFDFERQVLAWLAEQPLSFRVPVPVLTRAGRPSIDRDGGRISLVPKLPGMPLALQQHDGELLGSVTGELQVALRRCPAAVRPGRPLFGELLRFPIPRLDPLTVRPSDVGLVSAPPYDDIFGRWREEAARLQRFVRGVYRQLPMQLCHNDVTPNNVLAENGTVTAVLDFEYVTPSARALDFVTGLRMVMPYWQDPAPWPAARAYSRGYAQWVTLADAEIAAIPDLLRLRAAVTVLWWLGRTAATGEAGLLASRLGFFLELLEWLEGAERPLMEVIDQELRR